MKNFSLAFSLFLASLLPSLAVSQYDESPEYAMSEARMVTLGVLQRDFRPRGGNSAADSIVIDYRRLMPVVAFRQGPVDLMVGYTTYSLGGTSRSAILLAASASRDVPLAGKRPSALVVPLTLAADFTKAEAKGLERDNFNIASIGLGAGLKFRYSSPSLDLAIQVVQSAQFSSEGFGTGTGFSALTVADASIQLRRIGVLDGIALGYRARYQTWSMSNSNFDYKSLSHGPYLGILF